MAVDSQPGSPRERDRVSVSSFVLRLASGIKKYSPAFLVECIIFYLALLPYQAIEYFGRVGPVQLISLGLALVPVSMAAGEATFRLYRRVWLVAGLQDAIAIALTGWSLTGARLDEAPPGGGSIVSDLSVDREFSFSYRPY